MGDHISGVFLKAPPSAHTFAFDYGGITMETNDEEGAGKVAKTHTHIHKYRTVSHLVRCASLQTSTQSHTSDRNGVEMNERDQLGRITALQI